MKNVRFNRFCLIYMQRCHTNLFSHFISMHEGFFSLLVVEIKIKRKIFTKEQPKKLLLGNFLFLQLLKEFEYIHACVRVCVYVAQSCPTLCDPMGCIPPGFLCPWIFPDKNTGVGCHSLLQAPDMR